MKTTITNKFHNFKKVINHRGELPSISSLRKAHRDSKASDCKSETLAVREDGREVVIANFGGGMEVVLMD